MSKKGKLIDKIRNNPTDVRFETIQTILLELGFKERQPKGGSSHFTYTLSDIILTVPKHRPVNKVYVKQVIKAIDEILNK